MRLLDRYLLRQFLKAYAYCSAAFLAIWLVFDIGDKINTFLEEDVSFASVVEYYLTQVPEIIVTILPMALLLALLFCLSRMSRTNEIVSMLAAGISVPRLLVPLIVVGLLTTGVSGALNYSLAPHAEQARKQYYEEMRGAEERDQGLVAQIFRNRTDNRTWFIQRFRPEKNEFQTVQVLQQDANENIVTNYLAASASYNAARHAWELRQVKVVNYDESGNITNEQTFDSLVVTDWSETPFRLASSNMRADVLSLPELRDYLRFNADFPHALLAPFATQLHYRLALPWTALIVVFLAAPLAIGFSRTGLLTNVAVAIGLFVLMQFLTHLFLALGEGDRIPAWSAAWIPNILFAALGLLLLRVRATNRELHDLHPFAARALPA